MLKLSKFTQIVHESDTLILYNAYSGKLISLAGRLMEQMLSLVKHDGIDENNDNTRLVSILLDNNMLVPYNTNEDTLVENLEEEVMCGSDVLKLIIMPTEQCNFRCKYCYELFEKGKMSKEIQDKLVTFVERHLDEFRALNVEWFGGEPLLALDVITYMSEKFIAICKKSINPILLQ